MLLHIYATYAWPETTKADPVSLGANGAPRTRRPRHAHSASEEQRLRDAEEFELEGLISEDEGADDRDKDDVEHKANGRAPLNGSAA